MKCPNKACGKSNAVVHVRQLCTTGIHMDEGELVVGETVTFQEWNEVEPEYVVCAQCDFKGPPEAFGLYTGKLLKDKLDRLIHEALESDNLAALPKQLMDVVLPVGGILIHKGGI